MVETTDDAVIMDRKSELIPELALSKKEKGLDFLFLAVVNIVVMRSNLLMCDLPELELAKLTFGGEITSTGVMDLGSRVSRKKQFVPPMTASIGSFTMPTPRNTASSNDLASLASPPPKCTEFMIDPKDPHGKIQRVFSGSTTPVSSPVLTSRKGMNEPPPVPGMGGPFVASEGAEEPPGF